MSIEICDRQKIAPEKQEFGMQIEIMVHETFHK